MTAVESAAGVAALAPVARAIMPALASNAPARTDVLLRIFIVATSRSFWSENSNSPPRIRDPAERRHTAALETNSRFESDGPAGAYRLPC
ncbi:hypothetical protein GCM10011578_070560 [Streptomyces fuscichromogenes]|uniref:Uncharacterized protein n=1 Tax=Streptomyces fuscichromogenes TaxID=1324013 RepID=A0A917XJ91_9ACTN|nr:hypothetical protein GCM10011578_070560 [Streptomyces fuscichromogenes]